MSPFIADRMFWVASSFSSGMVFDDQVQKAAVSVSVLAVVLLVAMVLSTLRLIASRGLNNPGLFLLCVSSISAVTGVLVGWLLIAVGVIQPPGLMIQTATSFL